MIEDNFFYHYTSLAGFLGILESKALWATHIRYLNDMSEQTLMWELIDRKIQTLLSQSSVPDRERLERLRGLATAPPDCDIFVVCFSKDGGDRLSQWRGYCSDGGVSVGFREGALRDLCLRNIKVREEPLSMSAGWLAEVWYAGVDEIAGKFADQYLKPTLTENEWAWPTLVSIGAARLKHPAFCEEREWRILYQVDSPALQYRIRNSMMVPYVELPLNDFSSLLGKIIVGPSPHVEETTNSIQSLMRERGITGVDVAPTGVPYRHW